MLLPTKRRQPTKTTILLTTCSGSIIVGGLIGVTLYNATHGGPVEAPNAPDPIPAAMTCSQITTKLHELETQHRALSARRAAIAIEIEPMKSELARGMVALELFIKQSLAEGGNRTAIQPVIDGAIDAMEKHAAQLDKLANKDTAAALKLSVIDDQRSSLFGAQINREEGCI